MKQTITLTNLEIVEIVQQLDSHDSILKSQSADKRLPISILWIIDGNYRIIKTYFDRVGEREKEINQEYFDEEHSFTNKDGLAEVKPEFREEFIKKKDELFSIKNAIEIETIDIGRLENFNFVPSDFSAIRFMLAQDTNPEPEAPQAPQL